MNLTEIRRLASEYVCRGCEPQTEYEKATVDTLVTFGLNLLRDNQSKPITEKFLDDIQYKKIGKDLIVALINAHFLGKE